MTTRFGRSRIATSNWLFPATIGLSAFYLFTLELVSGQLVLPVFGGTPGVWATALCFFTAILFLGYLYAHIVATRLDPARGGFLQLILAAVAIVGLILAPRDIASLRRPGVPEALNVLFALLVIAGPTAFLLASTTPLVSAWYARRHQDPWWLYATSNGASFLALIAYPFVIAPTIRLSAQRSIVVVGVLTFVVALGALVVATRRWQETEEDDHPKRADPQLDIVNVLRHGSTPSRRRQAIWLLAAFVPAGLLSATTNFITTDLVSAPLLWVGPLSIYLLSFVIAFSTAGRRFVRLARRLVPAAAALLWLPWISPGIWPTAAILPVEFGAFLVLAVAIHGRLAGDRPDSSQLTRFYLVIAGGGMLATAFVALIAPVAFPAIYEYPILIVTGLVALAILHDEYAVPVSTRPRALLRGAGARLIPYLVASAVLTVIVSGGSIDRAAPFLSLFLLGGYSIAIAVWPIVLPISTALAIVVVTLSAANPSEILQTRTFFGVLRVDRQGVLTSEYSGTTLHGAQFGDERRSEPTTYYVRSGPLGQVFEAIRARPAHPSIAVVGLGVGATLGYAQDGDAFTFFEIDQAVIDIARDPRYFTYISDAPSAPRIVLGDARLSLTAAPPNSYDLLILDAFSSDSVPAHLLTREAIETYQRTLRPGGLILFHLSNRHYELSPAVVATARSMGLAALARGYDPDADVADRLAGSSSAWVVVGSPETIFEFGARGWGNRPGGPVLTDDFSDLLRTLKP